MKIVFFVLSVLISFNTIANTLKVGDLSPQIIGREINGDLFVLSKLAKKPKVLNFFWVDCTPCRKELPLLAEKEEKNKNVVFVAIHAEKNFKTDTNYNIEDIKKFSDSISAHPKVMVLGSDRIKQQFDIKGFPVTVLLSEANEVEKILYGFNKHTIDTLNAWLAKYNE